MYEIKRGGHADMKRIYPMLEHDFHEWERPSLADCHLGLIRGAELLLLKDESGLEAGYAYMLRDAARRYALLGWLAVYPTIRGAGTGAQFLELIKARYARYECVFIEVTEYPELEKARRLAGFYKRHGWCETGIPYAIGFTKNRYVGRTFIAPTQAMRENEVNIKLNPIRSVVEGKRVVLIDDSIVRGTTSRQIVTLLREAGAREVHMRSSAPPFIAPCYFGTDIPDRDSLIACRYSVEEIRALIGADSLGFLSLEALHQIAPDAACGFCDGCFTGTYPINV